MIRRVHRLVAWACRTYPWASRYYVGFWLVNLQMMITMHYVATDAWSIWHLFVTFVWWQAALATLGAMILVRWWAVLDVELDPPATIR